MSDTTRWHWSDEEEMTYMFRMGRNKAAIERIANVSSSEAAKALSHTGGKIALVCGRLTSAVSQCIDEGRDTGKAPVLSGGHVPRSVIHDIAVEMLTACIERQESPSHELAVLLATCLRVDRHRRASGRGIETRQKCIVAEAQIPDVGTRELAKACGVNPSTVSRLRNDPQYMREVEIMREQLAARR
jgi:hypothetical protein